MLKSILTRDSISEKTKHRIRELKRQPVRDRAVRNGDYLNNGYRKRELQDEVRRALRPDVDKLLRHRPGDDRGYEARARPTRGFRKSLKDMMLLIQIGVLGDRAPKHETLDALRPILHTENGGRGQSAGRSAK